MPNITVDENIIFAREAFSGLGNVTLLPGRKITAETLKDTDILLIRSVTKVNENLLGNSDVKFVGTATIGNDHIDRVYLESKGIKFKDAVGCNADAVTEYFFTALFELAAEKKLNIQDLSLGVVGVGNIGSRVAKLAGLLGMKVLKNDPPLKRLTGREDYIELDELMDADIITLHVPLNKEGTDKTVHLFDEERLKKIKDGVILINASRGPVIDNAALLNLIESKKINTVLDVWENEPGINTKLLSKVKIGTPHIAGYSYEGKVNGTIILYKALCSFLDKAPAWIPPNRKVENNIIEAGTGDLQKIFSKIYNIRHDDFNLRKISGFKDKEQGKYFDRLRKEYELRREFNNYKIKLKGTDKDFENLLRQFRFDII